MRAISSLLFAVLCATAPLTAQDRPASEAVRVFLDCQGFHCDFDYFRDEIGFVNWVRDRTEADVHILGTRQHTGGGGDSYTFTFIGQAQFAGWTDTLQYISHESDTRDEIRDGQARVLALGLVRYAAQTPAASRLSVGYVPINGSAPAGPTHDPWNYWVFRVRVQTSVDGQSQESSRSHSATLSANRTTEHWKLNLWTHGRYSRDSYQLDSATNYVSVQKNANVNLRSVWSLGPHWSLGFRGGVSSSTYLNQSLAATFGPAIEYDFFPYAQSTRRQLTVLYSIGIASYRYEQTTIFGRTQETRPLQHLDVGLEARQPWGSVRVAVSASQYLHDLSKHRVDLFGGLNLRLFRGLSLDLSGGVSRIKDQIYLAEGQLTAAEILVQQRQLGTNFEYSANVGFSYTFGSIFNNVVNPRMERSSFF